MYDGQKSLCGDVKRACVVGLVSGSTILVEAACWIEHNVIAVTCCQQAYTRVFVDVMRGFACLFLFGLLLASGSSLLFPRLAVGECAVSGEACGCGHKSRRVLQTFSASTNMFSPSGTGLSNGAAPCAQTSFFPITLAELKAVSEKYFMPQLRMVPRNLQSRD